MRKFGLFLLLGLASCTGVKQNGAGAVVESGDADESTATCDLQGQWEIENIVENDSSYVRPSETGEGAGTRIDFRKDHTFGIMTNCNHIGGSYNLTNDSIRFTDISSTEMACDNMDTEEMLLKILPIVNTVDCINDSVTRLNSDKGDSYIVLKKSGHALK